MRTLVQESNFGAAPESVQDSLDWLERTGLVRKTGEMRRAPGGTCQPVYTLTDLGRSTLDQDDCLDPPTPLLSTSDPVRDCGRRPNGADVQRPSPFRPHA